jgi:hypothetical protein
VYYFSSTNLSDIVYINTQRTILGGLVALGVVVAVSALFHKRFHITKKFFYTTLTVVVVATTGLLLVLQSLLFTNQVGSRGLSRRSADIKLFVCGQYVPITQNSRNKKSNVWIRDNVMSFQGIITDDKDMTLGSMFGQFGGSITNYSLVMPLGSLSTATVSASSTLRSFAKSYSGNNSVLQIKTGDTCDLDGSELQAFVYRRNASDNKQSQYKLGNLSQYVISDQWNTDTRDCVIIDFGDPKPYTDETCSLLGKDFDKGGIL